MFWDFTWKQIFRKLCFVFCLVLYFLFLSFVLFLPSCASVFGLSFPVCVYFTYNLGCPQVTVCALLAPLKTRSCYITFEVGPCVTLVDGRFSWRAGGHLGSALVVKLCLFFSSCQAYGLTLISSSIWQKLVFVLFGRCISE